MKSLNNILLNLLPLFCVSTESVQQVAASDVLAERRCLWLRNIAGSRRDQLSLINVNCRNVLCSLVNVLCAAAVSIQTACGWKREDTSLCNTSVWHTEWRTQISFCFELEWHRPTFECGQHSCEWGAECLGDSIWWGLQLLIKYVRSS